MGRAACVIGFGRLYALIYIYRNMSKREEELERRENVKGVVWDGQEPGEARLLVPVLT